MYFNSIVTTVVIGCVLSQFTSMATGQESAPTDNVWISSVAWNGDQQLLATQSQGLLLRPGKVVKLTASEPQKLDTIVDAETSLWSVMKVGGAVLTSDYKGRLIRFEGLATPVELNTRWIRCMAAVPNNPKELVVATEDGQIVVVGLENWNEVRRVKIEPAAAVFDLAFNPGSNQIAVAMGDGNVQLLSWPALEKQITLKGNGTVWSCVYSQDGTQLITGGSDRKIRLWDTATGNSIVAIASAKDWITSLQLLPQTTYVVAGCMNGELLLADYATKLPVKAHKVANSGVWDIALSPEGKRIAVGTRKHGVQIVDCSSWYEEAKSAASASEVEKPPQPAQ